MGLGPRKKRVENKGVKYGVFVIRRLTDSLAQRLLAKHECVWMALAIRRIATKQPGIKIVNVLLPDNNQPEKKF